MILTTWDGLAFFSFETRVVTHELWVSDGTETGTILLYAGTPQPVTPGSEMSPSWSGGFQPRETLGATTTTLWLPPGTPNAFRVRAWSEYGPGPWSEVAATPLPALITPCVPGEESLCLHGSRFEVKVAYRDHIHGTWDVGHAAPLDFSDDSGAFWFFDNENVELLVKVLDATTVNEHVWVFSGSMTDVEYTLTVTDTLTGEHQQYLHPPGSLCGQADVVAL